MIIYCKISECMYGGPVTTCNYFAIKLNVSVLSRIQSPFMAPAQILPVLVMVNYTSILSKYSFELAVAEYRSILVVIAMLQYLVKCSIVFLLFLLSLIISMLYCCIDVVFV